jgi:hypothetical protein
VLTVPEGATWTGIVRKVDGSPFAQGAIRNDNDGASLVTDDRGIAQAVSLKAGAKTVVVMQGRGWFSIARFDAPERGAVHHDLALPGTSGIRARTAAAGEPHPVPVIFLHETRKELYAYVVPATDGLVRFDGLAEGTYAIETRGSAVLKLGTVTLRPGETADLGDLDVGAIGSAVVSVRVPDGTTMPRGFHAYATVGAREVVVLVFLEVDGRATVAGLPPGEHTVRVKTPGFVEQAVTLTVPSTTAVPIDLEPAPK